jgi:hypothetical protein
MFYSTPTEAALGSIDTKIPSEVEGRAGISGNPGSALPCHRIEPIAAVGRVVTRVMSGGRVINQFQGRLRRRPGKWFAANGGLSKPFESEPFLATVAKLLMVNHLPG